MIFDIQRFASVTINPGQTYVTATTTEQAYTLYTTGATPQVDVDSLSEEIQALLATGTATGTVGDVTVAIDADGNITAPEGTDLASLIGQTVSIVGEVGEQTATIGNATAITATTDEGTAAAGEYTLRADATYTTYFTVTVDESGAVTSVSYFDGTTTQTTSTSVIAGQTLYGEVPDPTEGTATAGVDNAYAAATAINGLASDTNTANLTYSAEDGNVTYQKDGAAIEGNSYSVTSYSSYTATAANFNLTFDSEGKLTAVEGGTLTSDGTGFTVGESTDTYTVTATAGDGTLSGTLTTPAGAAIPVEFTATSTVKEVGFDVDANGTVDLTVTYTDGVADRASDTFNSITYTFANTSDTYTATSSVGLEKRASDVTIAATGQSTLTAEGVEVDSTAYSGSTTAEFTIDGQSSSHKLTFNFTSGAITTATDSYNNTTKSLTLGSDGAYDLGDGIKAKVSEHAFEDGKLTSDEITVTSTWNNGEEVTVSNSTSDMTDSIRVSKNEGGRVVTWKFDDTHYYAFVIGTDGKVVNFSNKDEYPNDVYTINGIEFSADSPVGFGTSAESIVAVPSEATDSTFTVTPDSSDTRDNAGTVSVSYSSSNEVMTITAGQTAKFTIGNKIIANTTFKLATDSSSSGEVVSLDGAQLNATGTAKFRDTGAFSLNFTTPSYTSGVATDAGAQKYNISFSNVKGNTQGKAAISGNADAAAYWTGDITITAGTKSTTFSSKDLTAWLGLTDGDAIGDKSNIGGTTGKKAEDFETTYYTTQGAANLKGLNFALGTGGLIYTNGNDVWYSATCTFTSSATDGIYYALSTTGNKYVGARLEYNPTANEDEDGNVDTTLTYYSTSALGTGVTADDVKVEWNLTDGTIAVTKAMHYDANGTTVIDETINKTGNQIAIAEGVKTIGTKDEDDATVVVLGGDKVTGTLDTYTLLNSSNIIWQTNTEGLIASGETAANDEAVDISGFATVLEKLAVFGNSNTKTVDVSENSTLGGDITYTYSLSAMETVTALSAQKLYVSVDASGKITSVKMGTGAVTDANLVAFAQGTGTGADGNGAATTDLIATLTTAGNNIDGGTVVLSGITLDSTAYDQSKFTAGSNYTYQAATSDATALGTDTNGVKYYSADGLVTTYTDGVASSKNLVITSGAAQESAVTDKSKLPITKFKLGDAAEITGAGTGESSTNGDKGITYTLLKSDGSTTATIASDVSKFKASGAAAAADSVAVTATVADTTDNKIAANDTFTFKIGDATNGLEVTGTIGGTLTASSAITITYTATIAGKTGVTLTGAGNVTYTADMTKDDFVTAVKTAIGGKTFTSAATDLTTNTVASINGDLTVTGYQTQDTTPVAATITFSDNSDTVTSLDNLTIKDITLTGANASDGDVSKETITSGGTVYNFYSDGSTASTALAAKGVKLSEVTTKLYYTSTPAAVAATGTIAAPSSELSGEGFKAISLNNGDYLVLTTTNGTAIANAYIVSGEPTATPTGNTSKSVYSSVKVGEVDLGYYDGTANVKGFYAVGDDGKPTGTAKAAAAIAALFAAVTMADVDEEEATFDGTAAGSTATELNTAVSTYIDAVGSNKFSENSNVTGSIGAGSVTDSNITTQFGTGKSLNVINTLADMAMEGGQRVYELTVGSAKFYLVGEYEVGDDNAVTLNNASLYNAAGVKLDSDDYDQGLFVQTNDEGVSTLYLDAQGTGVNTAVAVAITKEEVTEGSNTITRFVFTAGDGTDTAGSKLKTEIGFDSLSSISAVDVSVFNQADLAGYTSWSKLGSDASAKIADANTGRNRVTATYLKSLYSTEADFTAALNGGAAGVTYNISTSDNGYTGMIALGSSATSGENAATPIVSADGKQVSTLYAAYTYSANGTFTITGLYSDAAGTATVTKGYSYTANTITSSDTANAITYTLKPSTYSDVTISLTSGAPTFVNDEISMTFGTDAATGTSTAATAFRVMNDSSTGLQFTLTGTGVTKAYTVNTVVDASGTTTYNTTEISGASYANGVATWSDTTNTYTAAWNDANGNGTVDTSDTVSIVSVPTSAAMEANATIELGSSTYKVTATGFGDTAIKITDASDTAVTASELGYKLSFVDGNSNGQIDSADYFTYTSNTGDTVSGTTVASTETGTLGDVTGVVRYSAISTDGTTTTYTFASDATVTAAAEFTINGVTYTANADGTVSRKATEAEAIALEQTGVTSDTTTYTLVYDATASTITLTNTTTGASEVTAVTLASEAYITGVDGSKIMINSEWEQQDDGTYTLTSGNTTYTYTPADEDAGTAATCTYITVNDPTAYTFSENEGSEPTLLAADGTVLTGTFSGTYTTVADGAEIEFTDLTTEELIAQITEAVGEDALADVTVTVTGGEATLGTAEIGGETSQTDILYNGNVIATIVDDTAVVNGTTLTFTGEGGTYTSVSSADGVEVSLDEEGNLIVGGGNAATIASLDEETNRWTLTEDVDNITNTTGDLLTFTAADGDTGYLADGDSWNVADNELTTTTDKDSAIKDNEGTIHTSDGVVTGANEDAYAAYLTYTTVTEIPEHYESAAYIFGVNDSSSVEGTEIAGVEGDDNFNIAIRDGSVIAFDDISDNATITSAANGTDITTDEDGASGVTLTDGFTGTINGAEVSVLDDDGVQLAAGDNDGIDLISGVSDGAIVAAPEGTTFATDSVAAGEVANFNINGEDLSLKGEDDGILINGNEVTGLDENAILGGDGVYTVNGTEVALDDDTSVRGAADGTAAAYTSDDAADDLADPTAYQNAADPADLKTMLADGVLTAAEIASLGADNITIDDEVLNGQSGVRIAAVDGVKVVDESAGNNTIAAGNNGMVRIAKDATGDKVVDASGATTGAILVSNSDNANVTLTGGAGNDTMIASANDVVNLSNGADVVTLRGAGSSTIAGTGVNDASLEVTGFEGGFLTDADALNVNIASFNAITDGKQLVLGSGAKINIQGTAATANRTANNLTATDFSGDIDDASYAVFGVKNGTDRVALINSATNYQVDSNWSLTDNMSSANSFLGEGTVRTTPTNNVGVDFGAITSGSVTPDLEKSFTDNTATFRNVQGIAGAAANTTLVGSNTGANEFKAGSGATTIIGGLNTADTIYGDGGEAGAVIFHNDDQGKDIVGDFSDKDAIWTPNLSGVEVDGSDVKVYSLVTDADGNQVRGENALTLKNAAATSNPFQIITGVGEDTVGFKADLGAESTYADDINFYGNFDDAVTPNKLIVDSTAPAVEGEALNINIGDGSKYWNIRQVDATSYAGDLVVDATLGDDTIIGGSGNNTLWGGAGSDLIQGGSGSNYIKYYMGFDGNDEFTNVKAGDTIELNSLDILGNVSLDDASFATATTSSFDFKMTDGSSLKVSGDLADVTVRINVNGTRLGDFKVNSNGGGFSTVNNND